MNKKQKNYFKIKKYINYLNWIKNNGGIFNKI